MDPETAGLNDLAEIVARERSSAGKKITMDRWIFAVGKMVILYDLVVKNDELDMI